MNSRADFLLSHRNDISTAFDCGIPIAKPRSLCRHYRTCRSTLSNSYGARTYMHSGAAVAGAGFGTALR